MSFLTGGALGLGSGAEPAGRVLALFAGFAESVGAGSAVCEAEALAAVLTVSPEGSACAVGLEVAVAGLGAAPKKPSFTAPSVAAPTTTSSTTSSVTHGLRRG